MRLDYSTVSRCVSLSLYLSSEERQEPTRICLLAFAGLWCGAASWKRTRQSSSPDRAGALGTSCCRKGSTSRAKCTAIENYLDAKQETSSSRVTVQPLPLLLHSGSVALLKDSVRSGLLNSYHSYELTRFWWSSTFGDVGFVSNAICARRLLCSGQLLRQLRGPIRVL